MKKIAILVDQLHSHGGIEKLVALKANYWTAVFGYEVTILSTEQEGKPIVYPLFDKVKFTDLDINYNRKKSYFSIANLFKTIRNIYKIQNYILKESPDFILVASHIPVTYFLPFLNRKAKIIKEFHFTKFERSKQTGIKSKIINFIEGKYDFLAVLSEEEKTFYPSGKVVVIPNPIEIPSEIPHNITNNENIAIAVLRFAAVKQLDKMVTIWKAFYSQNPSWKLHIFGRTGNDYFEKIAKLVATENLQDTVIFKGTSSAIQDEISRAKVLLMTSEQECFPMVILEANSVGIPVISFDCPTGPRNSIHHKKDGILVDYNNCDSFVAELKAYASDAELQQFLSVNARQNAEDYEVKKIMEKWNNLIFKVHD